MWMLVCGKRWQHEAACVHAGVPFYKPGVGQRTDEPFDADAFVGKNGRLDAGGPVFDPPFAIGQTPQPREEEPRPDRQPGQVLVREKSRV